MNEIIDADELQKKQGAPYQYHGMTLQEVPITGNLVRIDVLKKTSPCNRLCYDYRHGDCLGELWACKDYREFRSG